MLKIISNYLFYSILAMALLCCKASAESIDDVSAESLWIDTQGRSQKVMFAQFIGDKWHDESLVYETPNAMTSLAFGTAPSGEKLMVWTEQNRSKTELVFMTARKVGGTLKWSKASTFSNKGYENFSASIVYDKSGTAWVFWASTREDYSDIVLRKFDGSWGEIEQVHIKNSVPDIKPRASISDIGDVIVEWDSYDYELGDYVRRSRQFNSANNSNEQGTKKLVDKVLPSDVQLPPNMYTGVQALLHFPNNQMVQSVLYTQGSLSK